MRPKPCVPPLVLAGLTACGPADGGPSADLAPRPVKTLVARPGGAGSVRRFPGTVQAAAEVEVAFRVSGPVVRLPVKEGQRFREGRLLARIDPRDYRVRVRSARARLSAAEAQLAHAEQDHRRLKKLVAEEAMPRARLEGAVARLDVARAEQGVAARALEAARLALEDTALRAPFDGRVAMIPIERHQTVRAGQPVLVLQAEGPLEVAVDVPEAELEPLLASASSDLSVRFPGHDPTFAAEVDAHRSRPDRATRTYRVEVLVASPPEGIAPGMTAELRWSRPSGPERLTIPLSAVSSRPDGTPVVYLVEDGALRSAEVRLGPVEGDRVVVLEGVSAGETLLVAGLAAAEDGLAVRPMGPEDLGG